MQTSRVGCARRYKTQATGSSDQNTTMRSRALTNQTQIQPKKADQIAFRQAPGANEKQ
tara:strand:+ start:218 stop:391 length:174 start_codon:yes stop_codon:yes gene_type:complete